MRKIILYLATSIDGFIAKADGSVGWLETEVDLGEYSFDKFMTQIDSIIMGRTSYEQNLTFGDWGFRDHSTFVFSSKSFEPTTPRTSVVSRGHLDFVQNLKQEEGKDTSEYIRDNLMSVEYDAMDLAIEADQKIRDFQREGHCLDHSTQ